MRIINPICLSLISILWLIPSAYSDELSMGTWIRGEYLGWTLRNSPDLPPLVTSASLSDAVPGAIGQPGTRVLLGSKSDDMRWRNGFNLSTGTTLYCEQTISVEGSYFLLPKTSTRKSLYTIGEPGSPNLAVPIYDVTGFWGLNGIPGETVFILPGPLFDDPGFEGRFSLKTSSLFQGAELNVGACLTCCNGFSFEGLGGFRWLQLQEDLKFTTHTKTLPTVPFPPDFYNATDRFRTANNFYGAQLGLRAQYTSCKWLMEVTPKVCLGVLDQRVQIHGSGETLAGNLFYTIRGPANLAGGLFAQPTNIGNHKRNTFAATFETNLRLAYQLTNCLEVFVGYNILLIGNVARPANQINRKINPTLTGLAVVSRATVGTGTGPIPFGEPGPAEAPQGLEDPNFHFKTQLFWAQGLTAGLQVRF